MCVCVCVCVCVCTQADVATLKARDSFYICPHNDISIYLHSPSENSTGGSVAAQALHTQLAQLRALQGLLLNPDYGRDTVQLTLCGWSLTHEVMRELRGLPTGIPETRLALQFYDCQWLLKPKAYKKLAVHVPTEYVRWDLWCMGDARLLRSMAMGVSVRRSMEGCVTPLIIASESDELVSDFEEEDLGKNITLQNSWDDW